MLRLIQKGVVVLFASLCVLYCGVSAFAQEVPSDYQEVLKFLDRKGDFKAGVLKVNIPRSDLKMSIQGFSTPTHGRSGAPAGRSEPRNVRALG